MVGSGRTAGAASRLSPARVTLASWRLWTVIALIASSAVGVARQDPPVAQAAQASTVQSGNWSDPAVWSTGAVPQPGDSVYVAPGDVVEFDTTYDQPLGEVSIDGTLRFSRTVSTRLKVNDNILVNASGLLDTGNAGDPIPSSVSAEVTFVLPQGAAFLGGPTYVPGDTGLWVFGRWESHGAPLVRTWSKLVLDAPAGSTTVTVENGVTDWTIGGTVVVSPTNNPVEWYFRSSDGKEVEDFDFQDEVANIVDLKALPGGQTRITLDQPLAFLHDGTPPFRGEVGLLTRNVKVTTEVTGLSDPSFIADLSERNFAHTIFLFGSSGNVGYTEFKRMGHEGALARYPVHIHLMGEGSRGMVIRGNSAWMSGNRWYTVHDSNGVLVEGNVGYDTVSSGYLIEQTDGCDTGCPSGPHDNHFVHNMGTVAWSGDQDGAADGGAILWIDQLDQIILGNVVSGAGRHHPSLTSMPTRDGAFETPSAGNNTGTSPLLTFLANEAHSNRYKGMRTWNNAVPAFDIIGFASWRNGHSGLELGAYSSDFRLYNATILENGISGITLQTSNLTLIDSVIQGGGTASHSTENGIELLGYIIPTSPATPLASLALYPGESPRLGHRSERDRHLLGSGGGAQGFDGDRHDVGHVHRHLPLRAWLEPQLAEPDQRVARQERQLLGQAPGCPGIRGLDHPAQRSSGPHCSAARRVRQRLHGLPSGD